MRFLLGFIESAFLLGCEFSEFSRLLFSGQLTNSAHPARFVDAEADHKEDLQKHQPQEQEVCWSPLKKYAAEHGKGQEASREQNLSSRSHDSCGNDSDTAAGAIVELI